MSEHLQPSLSRIVISGLVKHFNHQNVLDHLDMTLHSGNLCVLVGDNGAGKTTLLRILASLVRPDQGKIRLEGLSPHGDTFNRREIGYVGHQSMFYNDLNATENLTHYANLYQISNAQAKISAGIEALELTKYKDNPVRTYSRGMQQRLSIARALLHQPTILLFDEPYTGLDQKAAIFLDDQLKRLHQPGRIILVAAHRPQRMLSFATHIAWLQFGKISHHVHAAQISDSPDLADYIGGAT
jgi:heme exporter protein A